MAAFPLRPWWLGFLMVATAFRPVPAASAQQSPVGPAEPARPPALVLTGVTVIDVATGQRHAARTVVIAGTRVQAVGAARDVKVPAGARVIDAQGRYLIPGLWEMHAHVDQHDFLYPGFIAYGVTGLREMAQRFEGGTDSFRVWQRQIAAGTRVGPRVVGPSVDDWELLHAPDAGLSQDQADSLKAAGVAFFKMHFYSRTRETFFAMARAARRAGLPFVGHIPRAVTETEAADSGMRSIEHVFKTHPCWPDWPVPLDTLAERRCAASAAAFVRNRTWLVPTLVTSLRAFGELQDAQEYVRMMHRFGVPMLAGTDWGFQDLSHGASLHEELGLLVGAGFTPLEALQAATLNPAQFFNATDSLGTIAPGKLADLVLLDADPLADIHNTTRIRAVVANGRYFDATALAALRAVAAAEIPRLRTASHDRTKRMALAAVARERDRDIGDTATVYFGYRRTAPARFTSSEPLGHDTLVTYTAPAPTRLAERQAWGLAGPWRVSSEGARLPVGPGRLVLRFHARFLNVMFGPLPRDSGQGGGAPSRDDVRFRIWLDGHPPEGDRGDDVSPEGQGSAPQVWSYQLVHQREPGPPRDRTIEIEFLDPAIVYEATFDPMLKTASSDP